MGRRIRRRPPNGGKMQGFKTFAILLAALWFTASAQAQVYELADLNKEQIRALDRAKTVILIPGGILVEHGPYLPSYRDGILILAYTRELANAIVSRPG